MSVRRLLNSCAWFLMFSPTLYAELEFKVWTNTAKHTLEGKLISAAGDNAVIERKNGTRVTIPIASLIDEDQEYIVAHQSEFLPKPEPEAKPAAKPKAEPSRDDDSDLDTKVQKTILAGYDASESYFDFPWPPVVKCEDQVEITVVSESDAKKEYIYESPHFIFESNALMRKSLISKIALLFESSYTWHKFVPLNNRRTHAKDAPKLKAKLCESYTDYLDAGGLPGSAGVYLGGKKDVFMVPFKEAGAKKVGSGYMYDFSGDPHTMLHELTHQMWADISSSSSTWFTEGFAEYMGSIPYRSGMFNYASHMGAIKMYALEYGKKDKGGRALGKDFSMPHLENLMAMNQSTFYSGGSRSYGFGLLMVTYFIDMDGTNGAVFKKAIKAMQEGKSKQEVNKVFLDGKTYEELEHDFAKAWRGAGAKITFD